jgi:uncharacterized membrane protein
MMTKPTTNILFCWTFSITGVMAFSYGLDTVINSSYHGAGLMLAIAGLIMIAISGHESLKL